MEEGGSEFFPLVIPDLEGTFTARQDMTLANLLSAEQIVPEMKAAGRWEAIGELVETLVATGRIHLEDREMVLDSIKQREQTMSTGIGFGIAIPHASSDKVEEVVAAFGRSKSGIEFDSLDGQPVFFVVLFVVPKDQFQTHLRTLAAIAKFLNDKAVRDELGRAENADQVLQVFENRSPRS
jgi:fructose-specific phosphotransferase system IIA component